MPSEKQLAANRLNSQKSTGPRTPTGKAVAAANALKTGLHAESHVISGESAEAYAALAAEYYAEYHPVTAAQRALVDILIHNEWLLRRLRRVESELWNSGIEFLKKSPYQSKSHLLGDTFANKEERFDRLQRRINSLDRAYHRALKALAQLQAAEKEDGEPASDQQPELAGPQLVSPQIGFVPSTENFGTRYPDRGSTWVPSDSSPVNKPVPPPSRLGRN